MQMQLLADPNAAEVKLISSFKSYSMSLNAMKSIGHQTEVIGNAVEIRNQLHFPWLETLFCAHL